MSAEMELAYERGSRAAWRIIFGEALRHLGYDDPAVNGVRWVGEREDAIAALRGVCDNHGDNDWPNELHLADIIEKHLVRHLDG